MSKFKFELNRQGVKELMQSEKMQKILNEKATSIKNRCGDGYEQDSYIGKNRAAATVRAVTKKARIDNSDNNTLLKAVR